MAYQINILKPRKALNKAFLKVKPTRTEIERFKINLVQVIDRIVDSEYHANYGYDSLSFFSNDKTSIIPTNDLALLGFINSRLLDFYLKSIASTKQNGYFEYKPVYISQLPIRTLNEDQKGKLVTLVNEILTLKKQSPLADTFTLESQIDQLVYQLYGLTSEEIAIVEKSVVI